MDKKEVEGVASMPELESLGTSSSVSRASVPGEEHAWEVTEIFEEMDGHFHFTASGDINREFVKTITDKITYICARYKNPTIHIKFRSWGGMTTAAFELIEFLKLIRMESDIELGFVASSRPRIIFIAFDMVASCALYIFAQGDERYALRGTRFIFHHTQIYRSDDSPDDTETGIELSEKFDITLCRSLGSITKYPTKDWLRLARTRLDWRFSPEAMITTSLVTKLITW